MSLLPYFDEPFVGDLFDTNPFELVDPFDYGDAFGYGWEPDRFYHRRGRQANLWPDIYNRRSRRPANLKKSKIGKDGFQACVNVEHFQPNEITVKAVDNSVVVEGKHEEKEDEHGHIHRHFIRRYELPEEVDINNVATSLSSDGILTIKAPPKAKAIETNERVIPIEQTGPARRSIKEKKTTGKDEASGGETMTE